MRWSLIFCLFSVAAMVPLLVAWICARRWGLRVKVQVDPADPRPEAIAGYLAEIAQRLDERPERMRVVFDGRNESHRAIQLDLRPDRQMRLLVAGRRAYTFSLRERWIAEHPVPLTLHHTVLYVEPVDANRFRVRLAPPFRLPVWVCVLGSAAAAVGFCAFIPELVAVVAGTAIGGGLMLWDRGWWYRMG